MQQLQVAYGGALMSWGKPIGRGDEGESLAVFGVLGSGAAGIVEGGG